MRKTTTLKAASFVVALCFFVNSSVSSAGGYFSLDPAPKAVNLATASGNNDIIGIRHQDVATIKAALELELKDLLKEHIKMERDLSADLLRKLLKEKLVKGEKNYEPSNLHGFITEFDEDDGGSYNYVSPV